MNGNLKLRVTQWIALSVLIFSACAKDDPKDSELTKPPVVGVEQDSELFSSLYDEENDEIRYVADGDASYDKYIYVNPLSGSDAADGTSEALAVATLQRAQQILDENSENTVEILLYGGESGAQHNGEIKIEERVAATHIGSYGESKKARINAKGYAAGVTINNSSNVLITDIKISANGGFRVADRRCGIDINIDSSVENIEINNVDIRDVFYYDLEDKDIPSQRPCVDWANSGETNYGWGVRLKCVSPGSIDGVDIIATNVRNVSHTGYKLNASPNGFHNLVIDGSSAHNCGGPGSQFSKIYTAKMINSEMSYTGMRGDKRQWGRGSGMWLIDCEDFLFERCLFEGAEGIGDSCGAHIDLGNKNVVIQYCLSRNNAGGFCEILGRNYNCCYRYNISINDGWRSTKSKNPIQQAYWGDSAVFGCLLTLNGTDGSSPWRGPYQSYVYNNTIVNTHTNGVDERGFQNPFTFEIATCVKDVLVANNIFWVPNKMNVSWGTYGFDSGESTDKTYNFRQSTASGVQVDRVPSELGVSIKNNLYQLLKDNANPSVVDSQAALPKAPGTANKLYPNYQDDAPKGGDPTFTNPTGLTAEDMIPTNAAVINQGMEIQAIALTGTSDYPSGIEVPTFIGVDSKFGGVGVNGLKMEKDYFGNDISGKNILGACAVN